MITPSIFAEEMSILQDRPWKGYVKELSPAVLHRYYEALTETLDDDQFISACNVAFIEEENFPSPRRLLELAPSVSAAVGREMARLKMNAVLHPNWQAPAGAYIASDLSDRDSRRYLAFLQGLPSPDAGHILSSAPDEFNIEKLRKMTAQIGGGSNGNSAR
jgi:hypothetical protein